MKVVLASQSLWRKELLSWLEVPFEAMESGLDERAIKEPNPEKLVGILAKGKVLAVAEKVRGGDGEVVVLGADTVVVVDGENVGEIRLLGKPRDMGDAREMLERLRGNEQKVVTGVCVARVGILRQSGSSHLARSAQNDKFALKSLANFSSVGVDVSRVKFRDFSDEELEDYLATGESMGKAGAFGILGKAMDLIEKVEGSISGVIGLPLLMTERMLVEMEVGVEVDVKKVVRERLVEEFGRRNPRAMLKVED